ncbi:MAG TPA: hypothetical protein VD905_00690 [Flavobacteriales bacterium]|nr:hypothetical protein [Flavobacteriales bacterium]
MKYKIAFLLLVCFPFLGKTQTAQSCATALEWCTDATPFEAGGCSDPEHYWFKFSIDQPLEDFLVRWSGGINSYELYGPFLDDSDHCDELDDNRYDSVAVGGDDAFLGGSDPLPAGFYIIVLHVTECAGNMLIGGEVQLNFDCEDDVPCENCIGSFAPEAGKKYLITAWAKEEGAANTKLDYTYPNITVDFIGASATTGAVYPSGLIIDGWQRIEKEFTIPAGTNELDITLDCDNGDCLFDDIRVLPYDGSMKSYVYDPVTLRLAAELDERHYATFYEYDEEGKITRIKKETEKGIMTIQENKTSVPKQ